MIKVIQKSLLLIVLITTILYGQNTIHPDLVPYLNANIFAPNKFVKQEYYDINYNFNKEAISVSEKKYGVDRTVKDAFQISKSYKFENGKISKLFFEEDEMGNKYAYKYHYSDKKIRKINKITRFVSTIYSYKYDMKEGSVNQVIDNLENKEVKTLVHMDVEKKLLFFDEYGDFSNPKKITKTTKLIVDKNNLLSIEENDFGTYPFTKINLKYKDKIFIGYTIERSKTGDYTNNYSEEKSYLFNTKRLPIKSVLKTKYYNQTKIFNYIYDEFGNWIVKYVSEFEFGEFKILYFELRQITYPIKTTGYADAIEFKEENKINTFIENAKSETEITTFFKKLNSNVNTFEEKNFNQTYQVVQNKKAKLSLGNKKNGFAELVFNDSSIFRGTFSNGKRQGIGVTIKGKDLTIKKYDTLQSEKYEFLYYRNQNEEFLGNQKLKTGFYFVDKKQQYYSVKLDDKGKIISKIELVKHSLEKGKETCLYGNCTNGIGLKSTVDKIIYGNFKDSKLDGFGFQTSKSQYELQTDIGQFKKGKKEGVGVRIFREKIFFAGVYKNNIPDGLGYYCDGSNNKFIYAKWLDDKIVKVIQTNIPKDKL